MADFNHWEREIVHFEGLTSLIRLIADRSADPTGHKTKVCFLLGAGADISSGGLTFAQLKRQAVEEYSKRPLFDITQPQQIEEIFENIFLRLEPDEKALMVEWIFRKIQPLQPSDAYKLLVLLTEAGGIDAIVTTNFDLMLEQAQTELGRDLFQIFAPGLARPYLISHSRFEMQKRPYIKLHGDVGSRSVTLLTIGDLENAQYDSSMLEFLASILQTHDLVLIGYSGFDSVLAKIIGDATRGTLNRIFWCNPTPPNPKSPLYRIFDKRVKFIGIGFDDLMMEVARPVLEKPSLAATKPTYLRCLFDWRVDYCNREYLHAYGERSGKSFVDIFARRRTIEDRLRSFLMPNRPLAIVTGPSGFGKTTLGIRLHKIWGSDTSTRILLIRSRALPESGDLEQYISEQLGGLGSRSTFSIFSLEQWLKESGLRVVLYIDGANEFNTDLTRCTQLLRNIIRFCYFLPEKDSAIRVIVTIRQETWNAMLPHLDLPQLLKTVWGDEESPQSLSTIACESFTDEELEDAIARLRNSGYASIETAQFAPGVIDHLRDPYLLGVLADATHRGLPSTPSVRIYQEVLEARLGRRDTFIDKATLKDILASIALKCLNSPYDRFREIDINPASLRGEVVRIMKDLHIFVDAEDGFLRFEHDRTFEYFLALGLSSSTEPSLETIDDLLRFLETFRTQSKALAAARLYFLLAPQERFAVISTALRLLDNRDSRYGSFDREILFGFAREVFIQMAENGESLIDEYISDVIDASRLEKVVGPHQLRTIVQATACLPIDRSIPLLSRVTHTGSSLATTEANIYAIDKLVKQYLLSGIKTVDLFRDRPYALFFADETILAHVRLGRLISFSSQLGPDNTHPEEYINILKMLNEALDYCLRKLPWDQNVASLFTNSFLENCDRLLYNATPRGINRFFGNPKRNEFEVLLDKLERGAVLCEEDVKIFEPYTQSLSADIEYHLSHVFFILSSFNDLEATLELAEKHFSSFSNDTAPEEIDFFHAVLVYLHILHNLPYDEARFSRWEEIVLREWPDVLLYRPGLERGERRGFHDIFDRVFEDGFGVVYPYGVLRPSIRRRASYYPDYLHEMSVETSSQLPLYTRYLEQFLTSGRIEEAIQLLQTLSGVIVVWPVEGLLSLRSVIGHLDPRIRRATIRILAEAFGRHPVETMQFLKSSGAAVSEEDLLEIKIRQEARIGRRQIDEEEWSRIGHFLFARPGSREKFIACVRLLLRAPTLEQAIYQIFEELGLIASAER